MPSDALSLESCDRKMLTEMRTCPHDCVRTEFPMEVSNGEYDPTSLERFLIADAVARNDANATEIADDMASIARQSSMLTLYFDSFDYPTYTLYQEGTFDLLCKEFCNLILIDLSLLANLIVLYVLYICVSAKIGGWMSLAIGGSIISLIEIVIFSCYLLCVTAKELVHKTKKRQKPKSPIRP